jgi:hypothetical protein
MKQLILIVFLFICVQTISAQSKLFVLHPILGDTIEKTEADKYYIFRNYIDTNIEYVLLYKTKELYTLNGYKDNVLLLNTTISEAEILEQIENIDKLDKFFSNNTKVDSLYNKSILVDKDTTIYESIDLKIDIPSLQREIKKDWRKKWADDYRENVKKNQKNGMIY